MDDINIVAYITSIHIPPEYSHHLYTSYDWSEFSIHLQN